MTERRTRRPSLLVTAAAAPDASPDPRSSQDAVPMLMADGQDVLDRLATWLAEVSAEAALAGNGSA